MKRFALAALLLVGSCTHGPTMTRITSGEVSLLIPSGWKQEGNTIDSSLTITAPEDHAKIVVSIHPNLNGVSADDLLGAVSDPRATNVTRTDGPHKGERRMTADTPEGKLAALAVATGRQDTALLLAFTAPKEEFDKLGGMDLLNTIATSVKRANVE